MKKIVSDGLAPSPAEALDSLFIQSLPCITTGLFPPHPELGELDHVVSRSMAPQGGLQPDIPEPVTLSYIRTVFCRYD